MRGGSGSGPDASSARRAASNELRAPSPEFRIPEPRQLFLLRGLRGDARGGGRRGLRIAEIVMTDRPQVRIELVDERNAGRDVQLDDLGLGNVVEVLDERAQAVSMRGDEDTP